MKNEIRKKKLERSSDFFIIYFLYFFINFFLTNLTNFFTNFLRLAIEFRVIQ